jgi:hypothetical protein
MRGTAIQLAVCGGGGNDTLGFVAVLLVAALYLLPVVAIIGGAEDMGERSSLVLVLLGSIPLGAAIFLYPHGVSGNGNYLARFLLALAVPAAIGAALAAALRIRSLGKAAFIGFAGGLLIPGGLFLLLFASVGIGTGCLD